LNELKKIYKELKLSFVIFICLEDPFRRELPVYRFENICVQDHSILLKDEAIKVFINADGDLTGVPEDLADFLRYLKGEAQNGELVQMIEQEVKKARTHEGWEAEYMTLYLRDQENQEIGMERGLKIGRAEGEAIGEARGIEQGLEQGLAVLINSLKEFIPEKEALYQAIIKNEAYKDTTREVFQRFLKDNSKK